jgi:2-oxoglutarate ferredoxin oxidoreductase subunit beta
MLFGTEKQNGIILKNGRLKIAELNKNGITLNDILVHDAKQPEPYLHMALINMGLPDMPVALGVIRKVEAPVYEIEMEKLIKKVQQNRKISCVDELLKSGNTWEVNNNEVV